MDKPPLTVDTTCECGNEIMKVEYWTDEKSFCFAQYRYAPLRYSLWRRLRFLFTGTIYFNEIILSHEEAKSIAEYITSNLQSFSPYADDTAKP